MSVREDTIEALHSDIEFLKNEMEQTKVQAKKEVDEMAEKFRYVQFKSQEDKEKFDHLKTELDLKDKKILRLQQEIDENDFDKTYYTEVLPARNKELEETLEKSRADM